MPDRRPSGLLRYLVKCPRCIARASKEDHQVKTFWSEELKDIVAQEGMGAIFKCPRCQLPVRVIPSPKKKGALSLEKPKRRSTASRRRISQKHKRPSLEDSSVDDDSTRKMAAGEVVPSEYEVIVALSEQNGTDTLPNGVDTINLAQTQNLCRENKDRILALIASKNAIKEYQLLGEVVGTGGEAIVASARPIDRPHMLVVLKFQFTTIGDGEEGAVARDRVRRTFGCQRLVLSDFCSQAIELIEHPFGLILVERYIRGIPLSKVLQEGRSISEGWAIELAFQIFDVLYRAWERAKIVHRDIKPANVMIREEDGHLCGVLTDFGICRSNLKEARDSFGVYEDDFGDLDLEAVIETLTNGDIKGTPKYMAPEQVVGGKVDVRTDIYSLGATLYHALTGRPPISGALISEIFRNVMYETPIDPSAVQLADQEPISKAFSAFLMKCLEKEPGHRFQTPQEAIDALTEISRERQGSAEHKPASGITDLILGFFR